MKVYFNPNEKITNAIRLAVKKKDGYCPCRIDKVEDNYCMCKEFRESTEEGYCHCELYYKTKEEI